MCSSPLIIWKPSGERLAWYVNICLYCQDQIFMQYSIPLPACLFLLASTFFSAGEFQEMEESTDEKQVSHKRKISYFH